MALVLQLMHCLWVNTYGRPLGLKPAEQFWYLTPMITLYRWRLAPVGRPWLALCAAHEEDAVNACYPVHATCMLGPCLWRTYHLTQAVMETWTPTVVRVGLVLIRPILLLFHIPWMEPPSQINEATGQESARLYITFPHIGDAAQPH